MNSFLDKCITILIAEDDEVNYLLLESLLEDLNYNIIWAKDGVEAVDLYKDNKIDLVLMDIAMPIMNGIEATKMIKELNDQIPIVAQTAYCLEKDKINMIEAGCDEILEKPINKLKLLEIINKYLCIS